MNKIFTKFSQVTSETVGSSWAFIVAVIILIVWAVSGPLFNFSNTWQLIINTGTTIVTFLMVFLIQNTQNRDAKAIHLKLDAIIIALNKASNTYTDIEELDTETLTRKKEEMHRKLRKLEKEKKIAKKK